jgi:hypothetical protein
MPGIKYFPLFGPVGATTPRERTANKDAPVSRPIHRIGRIVSRVLIGGLHYQYFESETTSLSPSVPSIAPMLIALNRDRR